MFNLKKKAKQIVRAIELSNKDPQVVIAEIHSEFDNATERLLAEAKELVSAPVNTKGETLIELGFTSCNDSMEQMLAKSQKEHGAYVSECCVYYSENYPLYKFITEEVVEKICKKIWPCVRKGK